MPEFLLFMEIGGVLAGGIAATALVIWVTEPRLRPARKSAPLRIDSRVQEILPARLREAILIEAPPAEELKYESGPETGEAVSHEEWWTPTADR